MAVGRRDKGIEEKPCIPTIKAKPTTSRSPNNCGGGGGLEAMITDDACRKAVTGEKSDNCIQ